MRTIELPAAPSFPGPQNSHGQVAQEPCKVTPSTPQGWAQSWPQVPWAEGRAHQAKQRAFLWGHDAEKHIHTVPSRRTNPTQPRTHCERERSGMKSTADLSPSPVGEKACTC